MKLWDDKTDRVVFEGTEEECIEYTKEHPERKYYMEEKDDKNNDRPTSNAEPTA